MYCEVLAVDPDIEYGDLVVRLKRKFDRRKSLLEYQQELDRISWNRNEKLEELISETKDLHAEFNFTLSSLNVSKLMSPQIKVS